MIARRKAKDRHGPSTYPMDVAGDYPGFGWERSAGQPSDCGVRSRCGDLPSVGHTADQPERPATLGLGRAILNGLTCRDLSVLWKARAVSALFLLEADTRVIRALQAALIGYGWGGKSAATAFGSGVAISQAG